MVKECHFALPLLGDDGVRVGNAFYLFLQVCLLSIEIGKGDVIFFYQVIAIIDATLIGMSLWLMMVLLL